MAQFLVTAGAFSHFGVKSNKPVGSYDHHSQEPLIFGSGLSVPIECMGLVCLPIHLSSKFSKENQLNAGTHT